MSVGAPQPWPPPTLTPTPTPSTFSNDKSYKGNCQPLICTADCPQYCGTYLLQPPPRQPFLINNPDDTNDSSSSRSISPLIAVLAAAFLLLFYYTVISRLCRRRRSNNNQRRLLRSLNHTSETLHHSDRMVQDASRPDTGLDDTFIRQITVFKYRRADGLVEGTECAVCLTEFKEEESLRLMPNCEHAFHIPCIDTWLTSHSNCPLCRSTMNPLPVRADQGSVGGVSVAALQVERRNDAVLVVREVEDRGEVRVEVVEVADEECEGILVNLEERERKLDGNGNGNGNDNANNDNPR